MAQIREENMDWQQRDEYMQRGDEKYLAWLQRIEDEEQARINMQEASRLAAVAAGVIGGICMAVIVILGCVFVWIMLGGK